MVEKRFTLNSFMTFDYGILDDGESIGSLANICDLLNELHEENQTLKAEVKSLREDLGFIGMELEEMEDL